MRHLSKQVKVPGGWRTTLSLVLATSLVGCVMGYSETVLIIWGVSGAVLAIMFVAYLLSGFASVP